MFFSLRYDPMKMTKVSFSVLSIPFRLFDEDRRNGLNEVVFFENMFIFA